MGASCCTVRDAAEFLISEALSPASATVVASPIRALGYSVKPSSEIIERPPIKFESPKSGRLYRLPFPGDLRSQFCDCGGCKAAAAGGPLADRHDPKATSGHFTPPLARRCVLWPANPARALAIVKKTRQRVRHDQ